MDAKPGNVSALPQRSVGSAARPSRLLRRRLSLLAAPLFAAGVMVSGCASDGQAVCYSNDVATVCADESDGRITFSGTGLEPGSEVRVTSDDFDPTNFSVDADGSFDQDGSGTGYLSGIPGTLLFSVSGTDTTGGSLSGDITVET